MSWPFDAENTSSFFAFGIVYHSYGFNVNGITCNSYMNFFFTI